MYCPCEYADLGCTSMVKRKDLPEHMDSAAKAHNSLLLTKVLGLQIYWVKTSWVSFLRFSRVVEPGGGC